VQTGDVWGQTRLVLNLEREAFSQPQSAEDLLFRLMPLLKDAGITRIANITGLDTVGIPVALVVRPNARSLSVSQGKGVTLGAAKISAVMESLEQMHAERIERPLVLTTYRELVTTSRVADPARLPRTARPFTEDTRILWAFARTLRDGRPLAVPFELVHLDMTEPLPEGSGYFAIGSNGLASGHDLVSAISHGIWEVLERDAMTLFYERPALAQSRRRIALQTVDDPTCRALLRKFEHAGIGVAIWDMTSDVGVAAFLCSIGEREFDPLRRIGMAHGYGCHPSSAVALRRAMTEAAQSRLTRIAGSRDDIQAADLESIRSPEAIQRHLAHLAQEEFAARRFDEVPSRPFESNAAALEWTLERLEACGICDAAYVDLSRPEYPIAVARSIVPGLEGFSGATGYVAGERARAARLGGAP